MKLENISMSVIAEKLASIGGDGKLEQRVWRIRAKLGWHSKAPSAVRHMIYGERKPSLDEAAQIEAAHLKHCVETIEANRNENAQLLANMHAALAAMQSSDPEFFETQISGLRQILFPAGHMGNQNDGIL